MCTYNGAKYLDEQLVSILNQTHKNFELIIQDDGSTDDTLEILHRYAAEDDRIHVFQNKSNLGINRNFYDLIEKSTGDYVAISDQDDIWKPAKIETLLSAIGDASLVYCDSELIDANGQLLGATIMSLIGTEPKQGKLLIRLFEGNTVSGHSCLFQSELKTSISKCISRGLGEIGMYDILITTIASFHDGVAYYNEPLTLHRIHGANNFNCGLITSKTKKQQRPQLQSVAASSCKITQILRCFWKRKIERVSSKFVRIRNQRHLMQFLFSLQSNERYSQFNKVIHSPKNNERIFFNIRLYKFLTYLGIPRKDAFEMCLGDIMFYIFRFF